MQMQRETLRRAGALVVAAVLGGSFAAQAPAAPKPQLPFEISDEAWSQIERSEFYKNLPRVRPLRTVSQASEERVRTGSASARLPPPPPVQNKQVTREVTPVGDRCSLTRTQTLHDGAHILTVDRFACGSLVLAFGSDGKVSSQLERIEQLTGSLFPLRVGNVETSVHQSSGPRGGTRQSSECEVVGRSQAREVDPRLTGLAWKLHCKTTWTSASMNLSRELDDYYLEDLGARLSDLGTIDLGRRVAILPSAGVQTTTEVEGAYGSRTTTTYASHEWTAGPSVVASLPASLPKATPPRPPAVSQQTEAERRAISDKEIDDKVARREEEVREEMAARRLALAQRMAAQRAAAQQAAEQQAAQDKPASSGPGFFGGVLGGVASRVMERNSALVNSTIGSAGPVGSAFAGMHSNLTNQAKEGIAKDFGSTDSARIGNAVGSALVGGGGAGLPASVTPGGASTGSRGGTAIASAQGAPTAAMAAACQAEYDGPKDNPQLDWACRNAQLNTCLDRKMGTASYASQTAAVCRQLDQTLQSLKGGSAASYCRRYCN